MNAGEYYLKQMVNDSNKTKRLENVNSIASD